MTTNLRRAAAVFAATVLALLLTLLPLTGSAASPPHHRKFAVTTLSNFKVVLSATRVAKFDATVTAAGYRHTSDGWKLIATKRIGKAGAWFWFATDVCSMQVRQIKPAPGGAASADSIRVSLLGTPALGCFGPYTKHWQP
jgi:hypothetical protein